MKNEGCIDCGKPWTFTPSLKERGMTWDEAKSIFIDSKGGKCISCLLAHNKKETTKMIAKLS